MTPSASSGAGSGEPLRVFIVDDTAAVRAGLRALLSLMPGIEVVGEAADAANALEQIFADPPDVVLMDIEMPGMDGLEATRRLREQGLEAHVVVFSLAFDRQEDARAAGADALLYKGEPVARLTALLEELRSRRAAKRAGPGAPVKAPITILELKFPLGISPASAGHPA
jgi:DNA-binding NarL/FixJ family response regulator